MEQQVTAFGAAFASPPQTAAVLRARASAAGLETTQPAAQDLLAAVVAAQACVAALGLTSLSDIQGHAPAAALASIYCRAGGHAATSVAESDAECEARVGDLTDRLAHEPPHHLPPSALAAITSAAAWAREHGATAGVLVAAAEDLSAGWEHPAIAAVSDALLTLAVEH